MPSGPCQASSTTSQPLRSRKALTAPIAFSFMSFMSRSLDSEARPCGVPCAARVACSAAVPARAEAKSGVEMEVSRRQFFALFARGAHGAKNPKKCRGPCWPPAGVRPCASKERRGGYSDRRGAGVRHGIRRGRRDPPGMGCGPSAVAGALARVTSGRRVKDGGAFPSRGAATLIGTASPVPLTADMRTGPLVARRLSMRNGYGAAQHVRRKKEDG